MPESVVPQRSPMPLPPEVAFATPGAIVVIDEAGRLRDRSPRARLDPELGALSIGAHVPTQVIASADVRRFVHEGSALDALWFSRGEAAPQGGLGEREFGAMLLRLRNVVSIVVASLDTEDMVGSGPASTQLGTTLRRETDRLVDALSALAHAFGPVGARSFVDLELALRRALDVSRGAAKRRSVALRLEGARDARRGRTGDEALVQAAILALLTNAIEASPAGGEVRVVAEAGPSSVTLTVEDDGPGLVAPTRGELGGPFASSKRGGVGLGLSVARRAAFLHGGELHVATRPRGTGVSATMWLPTAPS